MVGAYNSNWRNWLGYLLDVAPSFDLAKPENQLILTP